MKRRIKHNSLGEGTVVRTVSSISGLVVKFDKTPSRKYNGGTNPCLVLKEHVQELKNKSCPHCGSEENLNGEDDLCDKCFTQKAVL